MNLALINAAPFLVGLVIFSPLNSFLPKLARSWLTTGLMLALFIGLLSYFPLIQANPIVESIDWLPEWGLKLSLYFDGLALLFGLIITGIGALIALYAGYYFEDDKEQSRFLGLLFVFAGAMLGLVLAGNLITLFIMWELTSISSFLLIGFDGGEDKAARAGAMQALVITGVGALGLLIGFVLLAWIVGNGSFVFELSQILQADPASVGAHPLYLAALLLIGLGAFTKSAQFPFHFWLPNAMAAPTPASAYLHSATMVKAGIYLLLRLYPAMHANELWTSLLVGVGITTMFLGAVLALRQRDLKALLAYSTVSWLGALVGMIGLPESAGIKAALVGILAHALYKAALFLAAGTIDHSTGTRIIDKLGGLAKQMPVIATVVVISGLSMAGLPIFFGFVAKEVFLDAWLEVPFAWQSLSYAAILISAALTGTAAFIFIWDVFFKAPSEALDYHKAPIWLSIIPLGLAIGTSLFGFFLDAPLAFVESLLSLAAPHEMNLHLLPDSVFKPIFLTSMGIVGGGLLVFLGRGLWLPIISHLPLPNASRLYRNILGILDAIGDYALKTQSGQVRYYLIVILSTVTISVLWTGGMAEIISNDTLKINLGTVNAITALRAVLLLLPVAAAFYAIFARKHLSAVLSLGVLGYSVGGLFLLEPAPDVSLVQFIMETLGGILIVVMIGRIREEHRHDAMEKLFQGRVNFFGLKLGLLRDILISAAVGITIFFFVLTALLNRPERESITVYHLENTYADLHVQDVVGAIVADYRGMDTVIEITVFSIAALGVLTILTRGLRQINPLVPQPQKVKIQSEFLLIALEGLRDPTHLNTPFTRMVARLLLPLSFLVALSHIITGGGGVGDGFTAGAISGLVMALWFIIFGYREAKERLSWFDPHQLLRAGLLMVLVNAAAPIFLGYDFLSHVNYGALIGIADFLAYFGLGLTTGLFFELGVALTVFGGIGLIMESIAHPTEIHDFGDVEEQAG
jgi:NADH:ubiquinone oxidoreductase subunit 5 (subunit L)/multisubunit Na+/H+ antiporter MnhA subunit